jgi:hypothetical protein
MRLCAKWKPERPMSIRITLQLMVLVKQNWKNMAMLYKYSRFPKQKVLKKKEATTLQRNIGTFKMD